MKKIILTTLISFGLAIAANAQKKGDDRRGHDDHRDRHDNRHERYDHHRGHNSHSSHGHHGHSSYGHSSYGHSSYGYTTERVWVPGCSKRVWVPPRYEYVRRPCGMVVRVCISEGYYHTVQTAGYYTYRQVRTTRPVQRCNNSGVSIYWRF